MALPTPSNSTEIPTRHEPLDWERLDDFAAWIDHQLQQLESLNAEFVTRDSLTQCYNKPMEDRSKRR